MRPYKVYWYKNDETLTRLFGAGHYVHNKLYLDKITNNDSGNYTCVICNDQSCISRQYAVLVQGKHHNY